LFGKIIVVVNSFVASSSVTFFGDSLNSRLVHMLLPKMKNLMALGLRLRTRRFGSTTV